jgi:hypothetical protein
MGATCFDFFPEKGLEEIEKKYNVKIDGFLMAGNTINLDYDAVISSDFIIYGKVKEISKYCGTNGPLMAEVLTYEVEKWRPTAYLPKWYHSRWLFFYLPFYFFLCPYCS